jgi:hypothetical protein
MGNLMQESSLDPTKPGGGLAQWIGSRGADLQLYATSTGGRVNDLNTQLNFLWDELKKGTQSGPTGTVTVDKLNSFTNVKDVTDFFSKNYERPGDPQLQNREKYASEFYNQFTGKTSPTIGKQYAEASPVRWIKSKSSDVNLSNVNPHLLGRLSALAAINNKQIVVVSGFRSSEKQQELYDGYINHKPGYNKAAKPGTSNHEKGLAVDIEGWATSLPESTFIKFGLHRPVTGENWHVELLDGGLSETETTMLGGKQQADTLINKNKVNFNYDIDTAGAYPLFDALDQESKFSSLESSGVSFFIDNGRALAFRTIFVLLGLIVLIIGLVQIIKVPAMDIAETAL